MELIAQGAEAKLYLEGDVIVKERISKGYRIPEIDNSLRRIRTRREAKVLTKLKEIGVLCPTLISMNDKEMKIKMSKVAGDKVRDVLDKTNAEKIGEKIGSNLAQMHRAEIMHADLTTSNMILQNEDLYFIDFGLSFFSKKIEDRAVDLHLLYEALESVHYGAHVACWEGVLEGYSSYSEAALVLERYEKVISRGRNKKKV